MNQNKAFVSLGIIAYLAFLIATIPASQGIQWLRGFFPQMQIQISRPEGSIWSGSTYQITTHQAQFHHVSWQVHPLPLLTGKLELTVDINDKNNKASATMGINTQGLIYIEDLKGDLPASILGKLPYARNAPPTGSLTFAIESIHFSDTYVPTEAEGEIIWSNAGVSAPFSLDLGTLLLTLNSGDQDIQIHIKDKEAQLMIDTTIVMRNDGSYTIKGKLTPKPDTDQKLMSTLALLGKKDPQGLIHINYEGNL